MIHAERSRAPRGRLALLSASVLVLLLPVGGGLALGAGAGDDSFRHAIVFEEVLDYVLEQYVDPTDPEALMRGAYEGMLGGLDAQSAWLTPAEVSEWKKAGPAKPVGPGIAVLKGVGALHVVSVAEGSPAEGAGIEAFH